MALSITLATAMSPVMEMVLYIALVMAMTLSITLATAMSLVMEMALYIALVMAMTLSMALAMAMATDKGVGTIAHTDQ